MWNFYYVEFLLCGNFIMWNFYYVELGRLTVFSHNAGFPCESRENAPEIHVKNCSTREQFLSNQAWKEGMNQCIVLI